MSKGLNMSRKKRRKAYATSGDMHQVTLDVGESVTVGGVTINLASVGNANGELDVAVLELFCSGGAELNELDDGRIIKIEEA